MTMKSIISGLKRRLHAERKVLAAAAALGMAFTLAAGAATAAYADRVQADIAGQVLRFHVRGNSDSERDQMLKLAVKDRVLEEFQDELEDAQSLEEVQEVIFLKLDEIKALARDELQKHASDAPVRVTVRDEAFPTKIYGDVAMPPGVYQSLDIEIGDSAGQNWWCVLYPPLCYVDVTQSKASDVALSRLDGNLSAEAVDVMTLKSEEGEAPELTVKFKVVEWWRNLSADDEPNATLVSNETGKRQRAAE